LYPVLKKMEALKYIKSYWNVKEFDRPRKYYKVLAKGNVALEESKEDWALMQNILNNLWTSQASSI
ncbi:MAG: helix-turn-helix transcriptional regulator, partial [Bacteroidetes bacterium]|nr:helix-turn-helix transcriptional regulator [Bacteroidota bacterium]